MLVRPASGTVAPGDHIGPYEIIRLLGAGGMGEVFRARDQRLGREVALKILSSTFASEPRRLLRFEREARAVAALDHPNVLVVHDVGELDGLHYLVTELLEGENLRERLRRGALPPRKAVEVGVQIARGLSAAHEREIVHRDLKPENVFLTRDGRAKILDFGLARVTGPMEIDAESETQALDSVETTSPGTLIGTVAYMSPEQARGRTADTRSDVFALGAVLYEMLTGHRAFSGPTASDTLSAILREDPAPAETVRGPVAPALDRVVRRCLEKEPSERFQTARDAGFALEALSHSFDTQRSGPGSQTTVAERPVGWRRRMTLAVFGRAAALVLLGALLATGVRALLAAPPTPRLVNFRPLTGGAHRTIWRFASDGERVYYGADRERWQIGLSGGAPARFEVPFRSRGYFVDASMPLSSVLMVGWDDPGGANLADGPLWSIPVPAGGARKLGIEANHAAWSPDGQMIAFIRRSLPSQLGVARADGSEPRILFESEDRLTWVRWSPDARRLRFGEMELDDASHWVLEIDAGGGTPRRLFRGFSGDWSPDGRAFVFSRGGASAGWGGTPRARAEGHLDLFVALEAPWWQPWAQRRVEQLTSGPLQMGHVTFARGGRSLVAWGSSHRGQLMRYDATTGLFEPLLGGLAGGFVDYSWDGQRVAWVGMRDLALWCSRADGTEARQLTGTPMTAGLVRWSPDGRQLAFVGRVPDSPSRVYVIPSDGGTAEAISPPGSGEVWDPWWLPDNKTVVWGRSAGPGIQSFNLETRELSVLPGTEDLRIQSCSRQGLLLITREGESGGERSPFSTLDPRSGERVDLGVPSTLAYPQFTRDGEAVVGCSWTAPGIYGFTLRERRLEKIADIGSMQLTSPLRYYCWSGLDPEDAPIVLSDTSSDDLYVLDWEP